MNDVVEAEAGPGPESPIGKPRILVASGPDAVARTAADIVVATLAAAVGARGVAHLALTGGSSASGLYRELRSPPRVAALDWRRIHFWFGDDRVVALDHRESNAGLALRELFGRADTAKPPSNVHPMLSLFDTGGEVPALGREDAERAAARYVTSLKGLVPLVDGLPVFDMLLLGMGPDGHILSVFPDSPTLLADTPVASAIAAPTHIGPHLPRITLTPEIVDAARAVLLTAAGAAKAPTVADVLGPAWDPIRLPAQLARVDTATWLLDPESAALLPRG